MADQICIQQMLNGGTYNGDVISIGDSSSSSVVLSVMEEIVTETKNFGVPKREDILRALKSSRQNYVRISNIKELMLSPSQAKVTIFLEGRRNLPVGSCLLELQFLSKGKVVEQEGNILTDKREVTCGDKSGRRTLQVITFIQEVGDFWVETTDQIRVTLTFPPTIQLFQPVSAVDGDESSYLMSPFKAYFLSHDFSDIFVTSKDTKWPCHKIVLACSSEVFKGMIPTGMKDTGDGYIKLDEFDPQAVMEMLRFIYTGGRLVATPEISVDLVKLAHKFVIKGLKRQILPLIVSNVTLETAPKMYAFGELYDAQVVMTRALSIAKANKESLVADDERLKALMETHPRFIYQLFIL